MKLLGGAKISLIDYLFIFCIIIYGANASEFVRGYGNFLYFSTYVPLLFAFIIGRKHKISIKRDYLIAIGVFILYYLSASVLNGYLSGGFLSYWLITLTITYIIVQCYGKQYFEIFETIVFHLTIIATIIWLFYLLTPDAVVSLCKRYQFSRSFTDELDALNIIFYTHLDNPHGFVANEIHAFPRNSGFAFEPGAFASILCFAIVCNIIRHNGISITKNIPLIVFLAALFSSESTTGGITVILIFLFWVLANGSSWKTYLILILSIPLGVLIFNLDFIGTKLTNELYDSQRLSYMAGGDSGTGRFMSFLLYFQNFLDRPIFGNAGDPNTFLARINYPYSVHSGFGELLSEFGALMTVVFISLLVRTVRVLKKIFGNSSFVILAAIMGSMVSYSMWRLPAFFVFIIFGLFFQKDELEEILFKKRINLK